MQRQAFWDGVKASLPTALGYVSIGIACGVIAANTGLSVWQVFLMSAFIYAGSAQFTFCALLAAGADITLMTGTIFLINLRHFLMSLHTATIFKHTSLPQSLLIGTLLTDESYGVLLNHSVQNQTISNAWMHGNNIAGYLTWIMATMSGTLLASALPNPNLIGLDFALIAMFVAIFNSQLKALLKKVPWQNVSLILLTLTVSYLMLSIFLSEALAVLIATLIGCGMGVYLDD